MVEKRTVYEVRSHSSILTNERINLLLLKVDQNNEICWRQPTLKNVENYMASLITLFNNVFVVFQDERELNNIVKLWEDFYSKFLKLRIKVTVEEDVSLSDIFALIILLDRINRRIKTALQRMQYFFRVEEMNIKGLDRALEIIESGGGIFGGSGRVQRISEESTGA